MLLRLLTSGLRASHQSTRSTPPAPPQAPLLSLAPVFHGWRRTWACWGARMRWTRLRARYGCLLVSSKARTPRAHLPLCHSLTKRFGEERSFLHPFNGMQPHALQRLVELVPQVPDNGGGECTQGGSKGVSEAAMSARAHLEHVTHRLGQGPCPTTLPAVHAPADQQLYPPSTPSFAQCTLCPPSLVCLRLDGTTRREA